jgi:hypothetical protein
MNPNVYLCDRDATFQPPFGKIVAYGPGGSRTITVTKRERVEDLMSPIKPPLWPDGE